MDNDSFPGTPIPPEEPTAENPPNGAMIDYFLPTAASAVRLEVFDAQKDLVRKFSSGDPIAAKYPPLPVAERWFPKPEVVEKSAGMHRFVWNLTWGSSGTPVADEEDNSNPSGPKAVPGTYQVRLTADGKTQTQALKIVMDPRSPATPDVLKQQFQLGQQIFAETITARRTLAQIGSVQKQLSDMQQKPGAQSAQLQSALAESQTAIGKILANKEYTAGESSDKSSGLQNAYAALASALHVVENGDRVVPSQAVAVYKESSVQVKAGIAEWERFKHTQLDQLNLKLREANVAPVTVADISKSNF
jgi:hypothetical protein